MRDRWHETRRADDLRLVLLLVLMTCLAAGLVWRVSYVRELGQLAKRARAEEQLILDRLLADLQRYRDQAVALADDPRLGASRQVQHTQSQTPNERQTEADLFLRSVADKTSALAIYHLGRDGQVLAGSRVTRPHGIRKSAYFQRAMDGALGSDYGFDPAFNQRVFYFASPSFDKTGKVQGVLLVLVDVEMIEAGWRGAELGMMLLDGTGRIFMSNRSELLGMRLDSTACGLLNDEGKVFDCKVSGSAALPEWKLDWGPYLPARAMPLFFSLARINMTGLALADVAPARQIARLQALVTAALMSFFELLLAWALMRRRTLAEANELLERRVEGRTQALTRSNKALRGQIRERQEAESALRKAQADLVQAGKLSALGQMSAGISHELNQPLMAIQQFAENGRLLMDRGKASAVRENLTRIEELSARAARIIRNLRAFARNESEPAGRVDLGKVIQTVIELSEARLQAGGVTLEWTPPAQPVLVRAGEVRLGQVFVNLINNAIDAMSGVSERRISITLSQEPGPMVTIRDTGPGIADPERLFEPFYSTKEVSDTDGMGLGLSISYGLVQSFGGNIRGENAKGGGAVFTIELEPWSEETLV